MRASLITVITTAVGSACLLIAAVGAGTGPARAAALAAPTVTSPFNVAGELNGVAATSAGNAWAVGYSGVFDKTQQTLLLHWNGRAWSRVTSPKPVSGQLTAVAAASADDAWAVGFTSAADGSSPRSLILHWNGKAWSRASGAPSVPGGLYAVAAAGSSVWAVGGTYGPALILHRTGGRWYVVPSPGPAVAALHGVTLAGSGTAWAGGQAGVGGAPSAGLLLRWNGSAWKAVASPLKGRGDAIFGLAAGPSGPVLAVGNNINAKTGDYRPLSMAWNGKDWRQVALPAAVSGLGGVGSVPGGTAWAVGNAGPGPALLRWTGKAWARVAGPRIGSRDFLYGVAASSPRSAWAVGADTVSAASTVTRTLILHWNGQHWS